MDYWPIVLFLDILSFLTKMSAKISTVKNKSSNFAKISTVKNKSSNFAKISILIKKYNACRTILF